LVDSPHYQDKFTSLFPLLSYFQARGLSTPDEETTIMRLIGQDWLLAHF
jgi:hypothetical protein